MNMDPDNLTAASPSEQQLWTRIQQDALTDGIDFSVLPFAQEALRSIADLERTVANALKSNFSFENAKKVDTHTHPIPPRFRALELNAAGRATPEWSVEHI